jgi:hypothetical protein
MDHDPHHRTDPEVREHGVDDVQVWSECLRHPLPDLRLCQIQVEGNLLDPPLFESKMEEHGYGNGVDVFRCSPSYCFFRDDVNNIIIETTNVRLNFGSVMGRTTFVGLGKVTRTELGGLCVGDGKQQQKVAK